MQVQTFYSGLNLANRQMDEPARKELEPEEIEHVRAEDKKKSPVREYQPPIPYPARLKQEKMSKYAKFLKEILSNMMKLEDLGLVTLNEECSAILQNKLALKRHDAVSFNVPYIIGELPISGALADLGASINLMPTSLFDRLSLSEPKPTRMSIQLANRTIKIPRGIVEDMLIKGESTVPLILGRPFLAISRAVIDVCDGKLQLRVDVETITFDLVTSMRHSLDHDDIGDEKELSNEQVLEQLAYLVASERSDSTDSFISLDKSEMQKVERLPIIVAAGLTPEERVMTLSSLRKYPMTFAYKIADIPRIHPSFCSHKILMEDSFRPVVQPQRRLKPNIKEVVKKEVVPKKGRIIVIKNEKDELIPIRTIPIAPEDQEKISFTCPYGTFTYRRISFGLCNAPTTFQRCMMAIFHDIIEESVEVFMTTSQCLEYDIEIKDKKGTENLAADHLSRLENLSFVALYEKAIDDSFPDEHLYQVIRRCVYGEETLQILKHCHEGPTGGHQAANHTARKVLGAGFYWPTFFQDARASVQVCDPCQQSGNISSLDEMPQTSIQVVEIFYIWGTDFIGPFSSSYGNKYILVAVEFFSKWPEVQVFPTNDAKVVARFGTPKALISDRGSDFCNTQLEKVLKRYGVTH
ncbi:uncharacterized protein LOC125369277 [Ricinus communis]|uniref:uncharacterized protein LOC125369277 n=1 Tax=Ricinus communis TaxID=3988 RepID=UPI00201ABEE3|nr:uncharacterized protein LOC125369277 [Ricinus communis]